MRRQAIALAVGLFIGLACTTVAQAPKPFERDVYKYRDGHTACYLVIVGPNATPAMSCVRD